MMKLANFCHQLTPSLRGAAFEPLCGESGRSNLVEAKWVTKIA
jgi:hypothetical protein